MIYMLNIFQFLVTINYILSEKCIHNCDKVRQTSLPATRKKNEQFVNNDRR